jgi:hypothetical protein
MDQLDFEKTVRQKCMFWAASFHILTACRRVQHNIGIIKQEKERQRKIIFFILLLRQEYRKYARKQALTIERRIDNEIRR